MEAKQNKIEVVYTKAKLSKRFFSHFIDIALLFLSTAICFSISNSILNVTDFVKSKSEALYNLREDTGLYQDGILITSYVDSSEKFINDTERKDELSNRINSFYSNSTYISDISFVKTQFNIHKKNAIYDGVILFEEDTPGSGNYIERSVSPTLLLNFYKDEVENYSLSYLTTNQNYFYLVRFTFWCSVYQIAIWLIIFFSIYYLVLPLTCWKRGRLTIGMKLSNIGLINVRAENVSWKVYLGRFFVMFFIFIPVNFVSFLIPSFISISMMFFTQTNSSLMNYVFNDYMVDTTNQKIYFSADEREYSKIKLQDMSIENNDIKLI